MTSSAAANRSFGSQQPRIECFPQCAVSLGDEFIEIAERAGLYLDEWQKRVLMRGLGVLPDGRLATPEIGVCVPRQNGKGGILEAIELGRLFVLGTELTLHSAHLYKTSTEAFRRIERLIRNTPELHRRVRRYSHTNGDEGIELHDGCRLEFVARSKGGGRGLTGGCLILDEAMFLPDAVMSALIPTGSAIEYRQVIYTGSAVDQQSMKDGLTFARVRERGIAGTDDRLAYFEWSVDRQNPDDAEPELLHDMDVVRESNPAYGIRISDEAVELDRRALTPRSYFIERLNIGDWPSLDDDGAVISAEKWNDLVDRQSVLGSPIVFAFDVAPDRSWSSIHVAGTRPDGLAHLELVDRQRGTGWIVERLKELVVKHEAATVAWDGTGPAGSLGHELELSELDTKLVPLTATEHGRACGMLFDAVEQQTIRHMGAREVESAIRGAVTRPLSDAWAWSRKSSAVDISPLVSATLALWALQQAQPEEILVAWA
jgi:hypothetical protein